MFFLRPRTLSRGDSDQQLRTWDSRAQTAAGHANYTHGLERGKSDGLETHAYPELDAHVTFSSQLERNELLPDYCNLITLHRRRFR